MSKYKYHGSGAPAEHQDLMFAAHRMPYASIDATSWHRARDNAASRVPTHKTVPVDSGFAPSERHGTHSAGPMQELAGDPVPAWQSRHLLASDFDDDGHQAKSTERTLQETLGHMIEYLDTITADYFYSESPEFQKAIDPEGRANQRIQRLLKLADDPSNKDILTYAMRFCKHLEAIQQQIHSQPEYSKSRKSFIIDVDRKQRNLTRQIHELIFKTTQAIITHAKDLETEVMQPSKKYKDDASTEIASLRTLLLACEEEKKQYKETIQVLQEQLAKKDDVIARQTQLGLNQSEVVKEKAGTNTAERNERAHATLEHAITTKQMVSETIARLSANTTDLIARLENATITAHKLASSIIGQLDQAKQDTFEDIANGKNAHIQSQYDANIKKLSDRLDFICQEQRRAALTNCAQQAQDYINRQKKQFMNSARSGGRKSTLMRGLLKSLTSYNNPAQQINETGIKALLDKVASMRYSSHDKDDHPDCIKGTHYRATLDNMLVFLGKRAISPPKLEKLEEVDHCTPALDEFIKQQKSALTTTISQYCTSHNRAIQHVIDTLEQLQTDFKNAKAQLSSERDNEANEAAAASHLTAHSLLTDRQPSTQNSSAMEAYYA